ncbi:MAG: hypothetical protein JXA64_00120 [Candidatus Fermentibacteraceae bacterium]|nr:hypothetical protein [Candidatus Fermentibacteraceae bacterium]MBN2607489.1 hypothetical protein [Candidatus Fermentibacteraceae bacterium]
MSCSGTKPLLSVLLAGAAIIFGCGDGGDAAAGTLRVMEESGRIDGGDTTDPYHSDLSYDGFVFQAGPLDSVSIEVSAEGFTPLTKIIEVSTGAVLAEWDSEYADSDNLTYTIASSGSYEARVYSTDGGTGDYRLTITVSE